MITIYQWVNYLKYLIPKWAGVAVRIAVIIVIGVAAGSAVNKNDHAQAADIYQGCTWSGYSGCSYGYRTYAPAAPQRPTSSQQYDSTYYPFWWDGAWHSSPTPSPSVNEQGQQPSVASQNIRYDTFPISTTYCPYPSQSTTYSTQRATSSQEYDSVRYPFWWDGAWHSQPTPKPVAGTN